MARKISFDLGTSAITPLSLRLNESVELHFRNSGNIPVACKCRKAPNGELKVTNAAGIVEPNRVVLMSISLLKANESMEGDRFVIIARAWKELDSSASSASSAATDGGELGVEDQDERFKSFWKKHKGSCSRIVIPLIFEGVPRITPRMGKETAKAKTAKETAKLPKTTKQTEGKLRTPVVVTSLDMDILYWLIAFVCGMIIGSLMQWAY